jgi:hypothetical protein
VLGENDGLPYNDINVYAAGAPTTPVLSIPADSVWPGMMAVTPDGSRIFSIQQEYISGQGLDGFLNVFPGPEAEPPPPSPASQPYREVTATGGIYTFGGASFLGSVAGTSLNAPVVGVAATADGAGYWMDAADGGVFSFGDAQFHGSMGGRPLNKPIVGMAATPDGKGYWEVASDGGIFAFGDAEFHGSMGGRPLNKPIVGMAAAPDGKGYWEVASDGGIFAFGDAEFHGSMGGLPPQQSGCRNSRRARRRWLLDGCIRRWDFRLRRRTL